MTRRACREYAFRAASVLLANNLESWPEIFLGIDRDSLDGQRIELTMREIVDELRRRSEFNPKS